MKTTNDIKDQCTTLEQSKKLSDLGFTEESASLAHYIGISYRTDGGYFGREIFKKSEIVQSKKIRDRYTITDLQGIVYSDLSYPCWTIADMMEIINKVKRVYFDRNENRVIIQSDDDEMQDTIDFVTDNLRDSLFDCLVWLKENKYIGL